MVKIYSVRTKRAVAKVDAMFQSVVNYIVEQEGECATLSDCLTVLKKEKNFFPPHVYGVLRHLLIRYMAGELSEPKVDSSDEDDAGESRIAESCNPGQRHLWIWL